MFCTPCLAVFPTDFSYLDLNPANLEATVAEWILTFLFYRKRYFSMTSELRHHYVVWCKYWWDILQFFSHTDCQDDLCYKLWKVVYIRQSYGQNTVGPFFQTRCKLRLTYFSSYRHEYYIYSRFQVYVGRDKHRDRQRARGHSENIMPPMAWGNVGDSLQRTNAVSYLP